MVLGCAQREVVDGHYATLVGAVDVECHLHIVAVALVVLLVGVEQRVQFAVHIAQVGVAHRGVLPVDDGGDEHGASIGVPLQHEIVDDVAARRGDVGGVKHRSAHRGIVSKLATRHLKEDGLVAPQCQGDACQGCALVVVDFKGDGVLTQHDAVDAGSRGACGVTKLAFHHIVVFAASHAGARE